MAPNPVFGPKLLSLPGGRSLHLREVTPEDGEGLVALFDGLGEDDLYCRFFQGRSPPRSAIENMTTVATRRGFRLVAQIREPSGSAGALVGECGYERLSDGDAELAITVARSARGWLGPYMLDVLLEVARTSGIPNLQADVLLQNRRMLALVRSRGYATMGHSNCPGIVRVVIGTAGRVPTWQARDGRPRVLAEVRGGRWRVEDAARKAGFHVLVCPGPSSKWSHCPAVAGRPCPLARDADVLVDTIAADDELGAALLDAHSRLHRRVQACGATGGLLRDGPSRFLRIGTDTDDAVVMDSLQHSLGGTS